MKMDTVVCVRPGQLSLERRDRPERRAGEVLVRVRRVGICGTDMHIFSGKQPYLQYPRVIGHEFAGTVEEADAESPLLPGTAVYVMPYISCGACGPCRSGRTNCCRAIEVLGVHRDGALAEYVSVPEVFVFDAEGLSLDAAAMIEFLAIGAHGVRRAGIAPGQKVLVVGAGPIGIAAAIFARLAGAEVSVVDPRADRLEFCRDAIGVTRTFAPGPELGDLLAAATGGDLYDLVFDATGSADAMEAGFAWVAHAGTYVLLSIVSSDIRFSDPDFHRREMTLLASRNATAADFAFVVEAMRAGKIPVGELATHRARLSELPELMPLWSNPSERVIKALVEI